MKGFIASLVTLCLLIGGIIWNGIWIHRTLGDLINTAQSLAKTAEEDREDISKELRGKWNECRHLLAITISHTEVESIDSRIVALVAYAQNGEDADFDATLQQLREELEYLHRSESLTVEGII